MSDGEPDTITNQKPSTTAAPSNKMDKPEQTMLKTAIEAILLLTIDNFLTSKKGKLSKSQDVQLQTILTAKLDLSIHANAIDHNNNKDARAIWKSISNYFASSQASNHDWVFEELLCLKFNSGNIPGFITNVRTILARFHEVGIDIPEDIFTYMILEKLPLALENLHVYYNDQQAMGGGSGSKNDPIALLIENSRRCKKNAHNPLSGHSEANCWTLYPEPTVSSLHSSLVQSPSQFILDSGSSAHMLSNSKLFFVLERKKLGVVRTSSGKEKLKIEGIETIQLINELGELFLNQFLYVPDLILNLLLVQCLILDNYQVLFLKNSFEIKQLKSPRSFTSLLVISKKHASCVQFPKSQEDPSILNIVKPQKSLRKRTQIHSHLCGHEIYDQLTYMLDIKAKRIGYYPSVIHSDWGTEFTNGKILSILHNSGMNNCSWNEIACVSSLTLNQISPHKSKKSPFELFDNHTLPLNYFHPIGNKVSYLILPKKSFSKIKPKGLLGRVIGYNDELRSFQILGDRKIVETN
ncbi:hypothetical protein VP01_4438g2 [Puccinia sorghi]|uniref:Retrovirus-related Pol polyprotein from transposon TNT 1-94-like beta-barrel domain-containing protein n=1 Tax=Puccinia sorghi TaxID=27349 RepID=A0A0L6UQC2_9BASI|nr:hypothetical protein VP01_4438g2 [Puccinia sorghi]